MKITSPRRTAAEAVWIADPEHDEIPPALAAALAEAAEGPRRIPALDLVPAAALARAADGDDDPLSLRRRYGHLGTLCRDDRRLALSCREGWSAAQLRQVLVGLQQGCYRFDRYRREPGPACERIELQGLRPAQRRGVEEARVLGEAIVACRDLINTPAADLTPGAFVREARRLTRGSGLKLRLIDAAACRKAGLGCLLAVGRAASEAPRLLVIDWPGVGKHGSFHALCGKGVCFDTGGLNIKTGKSMELMRKDMGGAATVLAAMLSCARLGCRERLRAYLPLVENAIGPEAFRPGDVLTAIDGTTVEIGNTDAEGRLILADAVGLACQEGAASITTVATLTGAALIALGRIHVPVMGDDGPVGRLLDGAMASGEKCWRLPLDDEHAAIMRGEMADLRNDGNGEAGCITAGAFIKHFAGQTPFAHCDISPASWQTAAHQLGPAGATGVLVSTLAAAFGGLRA